MLRVGTGTTNMAQLLALMFWRTMSLQLVSVVSIKGNVTTSTGKHFHRKTLNQSKGMLIARTEALKSWQAIFHFLSNKIEFCFDMGTKVDLGQSWGAFWTLCNQLIEKIPLTFKIPFNFSQLLRRLSNVCTSEFFCLHSKKATFNFAESWEASRIRTQDVLLDY